MKKIISLFQRNDEVAPGTDPMGAWSKSKAATLGSNASSKTALTIP